jgi:hypothetical protein
VTTAENPHHHKGWIPWILALVLVVGWNAVAPGRVLASKRQASGETGVAQLVDGGSVQGRLPSDPLVFHGATGTRATGPDRHGVRLGVDRVADLAPRHLDYHTSPGRAPPVV